MPDSKQIPGDHALSAALRQALAPIPDNGFSAAVTDRIRRIRRVRNGVLGVAGVLGILAIWSAAKPALFLLSEQIIRLSGRVSPAGDSQGLAALLDVLPTRSGLEVASQLVAGFAANLTDPTWLLQAGPLVPALLLALATPLALKLLEP